MLDMCDTGSWDSSARLWDPRAPPGQNCACIIGLPGKVFTMAQSQSRLVIGTSGRHVMIYEALGCAKPVVTQQESACRQHLHVL